MVSAKVSLCSLSSQKCNHFWVTQMIDLEAQLLHKTKVHFCIESRVEVVY